MGALKLTSQDIKDWCWATGTSLELWERRAIRAIDVAYLKASKRD